MEKVNSLEQGMKGRSNEDLRAYSADLRQRLSKGEEIDSVMPEAFALVREASVRTLGMRHFDVQLLGGAVLHTGMIAEMRTGEGKTLVATLPAYLNALGGEGVHVVTVNDYLAKRDAEWMGAIYKFLGLSVGVVYAGMTEEAKREAYKADITYGQNNEFGFDYLRDNMKFSFSEVMQRGHRYAIVDEVDSILIDEARTPLIISGPAEESTDKYYKINEVIPRFIKGEDYEVDLRSKQPTLNEKGIALAEKLLGIENLYDPNNLEILHHVNQGLKAHTIFERDVDYVVHEGQIVIVDEFTGRLMPGRRWSNGLHQAVEAKEGLKVARENQTLASITFQNYFRMYKKLAGMTGTADTEAAEFAKIYSLEVVVIPTNKPMIREDQSDRVYRTRKEKYQAVVEDIAKIHKTGQPVLVGTISIEQSERLSGELKKLGVFHNVLNAKQHEREAEIVAQAGRLGTVTISTNMAGRGTDIVLGGNPDFLAQAEAKTRDKNDAQYKEIYERYLRICREEKQQVLAAGGLFIMGTERHESRRIDNQLRGRAGRQGDPGRTRFYVSLEDDLMVRFGGDKIKDMMQKIGWNEGLSLDGRLISGRIESAQKRVEGFHFEGRKHVTEYDDVINKQRQVVYNLRSRILKQEGIEEEVDSMIDDLVEDMVLSVCDERVKPLNWELDKIKERFLYLFDRPYELPSDISIDQQTIFDLLREEVKKIYAERLGQINDRLAELELATKERDILLHISADKNKEFSFATIQQDTLLETLDYLWNQHIQDMDQLKESIGLRGYGQKNPLYEYQREGFEVFQRMIFLFKETVIRKFFFYNVPDPRELIEHFEMERARRLALEKQMNLVHDSKLADSDSETRRVGEEDVSKSPDEQREKLKLQRKARRKKKK